MTIRRLILVLCIQSVCASGMRNINSINPPQIKQGANHCWRSMSLETAWNSGGLSEFVDSPREQAVVRFGTNELRRIGDVLTPTQVQNQPTLTWSSSPDRLYSVFMFDPDAPSRNNPKVAQWYHWGVVNVPGNDIRKGAVVTEYFGAAPPPGSGKHRYVIVVYEQDRRLSVTEDMQIGMTAKGRSNQDIRDIAKKFGLKAPLAGSYFEAEWDKSVPMLYNKLK